MKMDLDKYSINRSIIQKEYDRSGVKSIRDFLSIWSASTHCPLICMAFYLAEEIGYTPELIDIIDSTVKFYGYTEVLGQKEGSPYLTSLKRSDIS